MRARAHTHTHARTHSTTHTSVPEGQVLECLSIMMLKGCLCRSRAWYVSLHCLTLLPLKIPYTGRYCSADSA